MFFYFLDFSSSDIFHLANRMLLAAGTSFFWLFFLAPSFIAKVRQLKWQQTIRTAEAPKLGELHAKKQDTPTMGGLLILQAMLVSLILWMDWTQPFTWILLLTTFVLGGIGFIDDYLKIQGKNTKGLSAKRKFYGQILFSAALSFYLINSAPVIELPPSLQKKEAFHLHEVQLRTVQKEEQLNNIYCRLYLPFIKEGILLSGLSLLFMPLFFAFVISGASNAVNLTDGLDGLASGLLVLSALSFACIAFFSANSNLSAAFDFFYLPGASEIAVYLFAMIGALVAFLWYNALPAQIFMGDTGSLALGAILGVIAILLRKEFLLALIGGVFVLETLSVILQVASYRWRHQKRLFLCAPLHHHFEYLGWSETKVVVRFWIVGLWLAALGLALVRFF